MAIAEARTKGLGVGLALALVAALPQPAVAEQSEEDLAKQLANPVAALISIPFQFNYNQNLGPKDDGEQWQLNVQPVIPFTLNAEWNLISRTIVPLVRGGGPLTDDNGFPDQGAALVRSRQASDLLGATKMDRPERIAIDQDARALYGTLTNNTRRGMPGRPDVDAANPRANNLEVPNLHKDPADPRKHSNWPDFRLDGRSRSATVAIRKADGGVIGT